MQIAEQTLANYTVKKKKLPPIIEIAIIITMNGTTWELNEFRTYFSATIVSISGYCLC